MFLLKTPHGKILNILNNKKISFGKIWRGIIFYANIYHGSDTNITSETRFSLNIRLKSIYSIWKKISITFFRPYKISNL